MVNNIKGENVMDVTMGNQQVTLTTELAWLAGIWDGEGTFGIYRYRQSSNGKTAYCGRLTLSNTSQKMIDEIQRIFKNLQIPVNLWTEKKRRKPNHKLATHITIDKMEYVKKVCEAIRPYVVAKKERVLLLLRFIQLRQEYRRIVGRDPCTGRLTGVKEQGYSKEETSLYEKMKSLNQVGC